MRLLTSCVLVLAAQLMAACTPVVMPAGAAVAAPVLTADTLVMADGAQLPLKHWLPAGRPKAAMVALHGFNDYANFFAATGAFLARHGIASYAYDQRGFGQAPNRGMWAGGATLVDDLAQAARLVAGRHPSVPLYLLGESMGGAVVMVAMAGPNPPAVAGIILSAPAVWGRASMSWYQNVALWLAAHTLPGAPVSGRGLGIQATDNVEALKAMGRDPLVIKETRIDAVFGLVGLMDQAMAAAPGIDTPALVLYGLNDQLIPEAALREMLARLPAEPRHPRRIAFYGHGWHMLLQDLQRQTVWDDILSFVTRPAAPLPSGAERAAAVHGACPGLEVCVIVGPSQSNAAKHP
jgi:alpha-beta hydrolase superfamily lysophospholipase